MQNERWKISGTGGPAVSLSGMSADLSELFSMTEGIGHGSTALVIDTGDVYFFNIMTHSWEILGG